MQIAPAEQELCWVKSFDLIYGTKDPKLKPYKVLVVDGDKLHHQLRAMENQERASRDYKDGVPNYVVAALTFVVSDRARIKGGQHGKRVITVPIRYKNQDTTHVTNVFTLDEMVKSKRTFKRSSALTEQIIADSPREKHDEIRMYHGKATNTYGERYHHSERALWGALRTDELVRQIAAELLKQLDPAGLGDAFKGVKVYSAIFDFHSTRYLCHNCEPSSFAFQSSTAVFLAKLKAVLAGSLVFSEKRGITLLTRVSAEDNGGRSRVEMNQHHPFWRDKNIAQIRLKGLNVVLQRDDRTTGASCDFEKQFGLFVSNQRINPPQPVYLCQRRDNQSSALELTGSHKELIAKAQENLQELRDNLREIAALRTQGGDPQVLRKRVELLFQRDSQNIEVLIECYEVYLYCKRYVEALNFALCIFRLHFATRGINDYYTKEWNQAFSSCFQEVFPMLHAGDKDALKTFKKAKACFEPCIPELAEVYLLRAIYFEKTGDLKEAREALDKGLSLLDAETAQQIKTLFTV